MSTKTLDFSRHYASIAHQNQRSGPILSTLPPLHELDDLIQQQHRNHEALLQIRNAVVSQEHVLAEQRVKQRQGKTENRFDEDISGSYQDEYKGHGSITGGDAKKRRGVSYSPPMLFCFPFCTFYWLPWFVFRRQLLQGDAIVAIAPKLPNGDVDRTVLALCAMHAVCITQNSRVEWDRIRPVLWHPIWNPRASMQHHHCVDETMWTHRQIRVSVPPSFNCRLFFIASGVREKVDALRSPWKPGRSWRLFVLCL